MLNLILNHKIQTIAEAAGAHGSAEYEGTSLDALRQMVSIGMGLSVFPALYAASEFVRREEQVVLRQIMDRLMLTVPVTPLGSGRNPHRILHLTNKKCPS